jgi:hypothetical protein
MAAHYLPHFLVPHGRATPSGPRNIRAVLVEELRVRQTRNPRYSLRAFAQRLAVDSATVSQVLRGRRQLSAKTAAGFVARLGYDIERCAHIGDESRSAAYERRVLRQLGIPGFTPKVRRLARRLRLTNDEVNVALTRLLARCLVRMASRQHWTVDKEQAWLDRFP